MLSAEKRVDSALTLASDILDMHTESTERDKIYRNVARLFLQVLSDEEVEMEEE